CGWHEGECDWYRVHRCDQSAVRRHRRNRPEGCLVHFVERGCPCTRRRPGRCPGGHRGRYLRNQHRRSLHLQRACASSADHHLGRPDQRTSPRRQPAPRHRHTPHWNIEDPRRRTRCCQYHCHVRPPGHRRRPGRHRRHCRHHRHHPSRHHNQDR